MTSTNRQKDHYETIHDIYSDHYYDAASMEYRDRFVHERLMNGCRPGQHMVELMCGDGAVTRYAAAKHPGCTFEGYDISPIACAAYFEATGWPAKELDIVNNALPSGVFDRVVVSAGLHHVAHHLPETLENIHQSLKPGGVLAMFEPNANYFLEFARRFWYRFDDYFEDETEQALDYRLMREQFNKLFEERAVEFAGGPAFFLVFNSMIFRIPKWLKARYASPFMAAEVLWNKLPSRYPHAYFVAQWARR
jgi:SAM-dependent methyltransferase